MLGLVLVLVFIANTGCLAVSDSGRSVAISAMELPTGSAAIYIPPEVVEGYGSQSGMVVVASVNKRNSALVLGRIRSDTSDPELAAALRIRELAPRLPQWADYTRDGLWSEEGLVYWTGPLTKDAVPAISEAVGFNGVRWSGGLKNVLETVLSAAAARTAATTFVAGVGLVQAVILAHDYQPLEAGKTAWTFKRSEVEGAGFLVARFPFFSLDLAVLPGGGFAYWSWEEGRLVTVERAPFEYTVERPFQTPPGQAPPLPLRFRVEERDGLIAITYLGPGKLVSR